MRTLILRLSCLPEVKTIRITNEEDIHGYYTHIQSESYKKPFVYKQHDGTYRTINPRYVVYSYEEE